MMKQCFTAAVLAGVALSSAVHAEGVKVGVLAGITGPLANFAPPILDSVKLVKAQVEAQGGLLDGKTMDLVIADTQAAAQPAVDAANKVIGAENVVAVWGALGSGATIAAATSVAIPNKVIMVSPTSTSPAITGMKDDDFLFRVVASDDYQGNVLAKVVMEEGIKKVAITYINNDYGVGIAKTFMESYKAAGGTITGEQKHEEKKASYRAELATLAKGDAEALVVIAYAGGSGIKIVRESLENGFFTRFIGTDGLRDTKLVEEIGAENLKGIFFTSPSAPQGSTAREKFVKAFEEAYKTAKDKIFIEQSYDAAFMIALAIEKAGSTDRGKIRDALRAIASPPGEVIEPGEWAKAKKLIAEGKDINYEGVAGSQDFDANGDVSGFFGKFVLDEKGGFKEVKLYE